MLLPPYDPPRTGRGGLRPVCAPLIAVLAAAACAHLPAPSDPVSTGAVPSHPVPSHPVPSRAPAADAAVALTALDDAGLAALLANPGPERLVVNFWATWCGPCVREMGVFRDVAAAHPEVRFALVNVERAGSPGVHRILASEGGGLPAYSLDTDDAAGLLARAVPAWPGLIPVTLVLDPGGAVAARFDGELDASALRAALAP